MSRPAQRALLTVRLVIEQPWAVGGVSTYDFTAPPRRDDDDDPVVYLPALKDPRDQSPVLPATSLVGSLRAHLHNPVRWLGGPDAPSPVRALGARLQQPAPMRVRTSTAIDPTRRAALAGALRSEELVEPPAAGSEVVWWLQLDHDRDVADVDDLAQQLWTWQPVVGRRRGVGRGRAQVAGVEVAVLDLSTSEGLTWWLAERSGWMLGAPTAPKPPGWRRVIPAEPVEEPQRRERVWQVTAVEPLHLFDRAGTLPGEQGRVALTRTFIPGSSWRGVFRHRVAHIARMRGADHTTVDAIQHRLFGHGRGRGASADSGGRGQLWFADSPVQLAGPLQILTHVAIDRVTGGARQFSETLTDDTGQGALFTVQAVPPGSTTNLRIGWTGQLTADDQALLEAVVADFNDTIIGVGGLTSRGYGTVTLQPVLEESA